MLKIKHINGEREIPGRQKVVRWSDISVLTSHTGLNPRSCTALSLTASFVSPYGLGYIYSGNDSGKAGELSRARSASYQKNKKCKERSKECQTQ